jgi:hypothetical protein
MYVNFLFKTIISPLKSFFSQIPESFSDWVTRTRSICVGISDHTLSIEENPDYNVIDYRQLSFVETFEGLRNLSKEFLEDKLKNGNLYVCLDSNIHMNHHNYLSSQLSLLTFLVSQTVSNELYRLNESGLFDNQNYLKHLTLSNFVFSNDSGVISVEIGDDQIVKELDEFVSANQGAFILFVTEDREFQIKLARRENSEVFATKFEEFFQLNSSIVSDFESELSPFSLSWFFKISSFPPESVKKAHQATIRFPRNQAEERLRVKAVYDNNESLPTLISIPEAIAKLNVSKFSEINTEDLKIVSEKFNATPGFQESLSKEENYLKSLISSISDFDNKFEKTDQISVDDDLVKDFMIQSARDHYSMYTDSYERRHGHKPNSLFVNRAIMEVKPDSALPEPDRIESEDIDNFVETALTTALNGKMKSFSEIRTARLEKTARFRKEMAEKKAKKETDFVEKMGPYGVKKVTRTLSLDDDATIGFDYPKPKKRENNDNVVNESLDNNPVSSFREQSYISSSSQILFPPFAKEEKNNFEYFWSEKVSDQLSRPFETFKLERKEDNQALIGDSPLMLSLKQKAGKQFSTDYPGLSNWSTLHTHLIESANNLRFVGKKDMLVSHAGFYNMGFIVNKGVPGLRLDSRIRYRYFFFSRQKKFLNFTAEFSHSFNDLSGEIFLHFSRSYVSPVSDLIYRDRLYLTMAHLIEEVPDYTFINLFWCLFFCSTAVKGLLSFFKYFTVVSNANYSKFSALTKKYFSVVPKRYSDQWLAQRVQFVLKSVVNEKKMTTIFGESLTLEQYFNLNNIYSLPKKLTTTPMHDYQKFYWDIRDNINSKLVSCSNELFSEEFTNLKHVSAPAFAKAIDLLDLPAFPFSAENLDKICSEQFTPFFETNTNGLDPITLRKKKNTIILSDMKMLFVKENKKPFSADNFLSWTLQKLRKRGAHCMISIKPQNDVADREIVIQDFYTKCGHYVIQQVFRSICESWPNELVTKSEFSKLSRISEMKFDDKTAFMNDDMKKWSSQDLKQKFFLAVKFLYESGKMTKAVYDLLITSMKLTEHITLWFDGRLQERSLDYYYNSMLISVDMRYQLLRPARLRKKSFDKEFRGRILTPLSMSHGWPQGIYHFLSSFVHGLETLYFERSLRAALPFKVDRVSSVFHSDDKNTSVTLHSLPTESDIAIIQKVNAMVPLAFSLAQSDTKPSMTTEGSLIDNKHRQISEMTSTYNLGGYIFNPPYRQISTIFAALGHNNLVDNLSEVLSRCCNFMCLSNRLIQPERLYSRIARALYRAYGIKNQAISKNIMPYGGLKSVSLLEICQGGPHIDTYWKFKNSPGLIYSQVHNPITLRRVDFNKKMKREIEHDVKVHELINRFSYAESSIPWKNTLRSIKRILRPNSGAFVSERDVSYYNFYRHRNLKVFSFWSELKRANMESFVHSKRLDSEKEERRLKMADYNTSISWETSDNLKALEQLEITTRKFNFIDIATTEFDHEGFELGLDDAIVSSNKQLSFYEKLLNPRIEVFLKGEDNEIAGQVIRLPVSFGTSYTLEFADAMEIMSSGQDCCFDPHFSKNWNTYISEIKSFLDNFDIKTLSEFSLSQHLWDQRKKSSSRNAIALLWKSNEEFTDASLRFPKASSLEELAEDIKLEDTVIEKRFVSSKIPERQISKRVSLMLPVEINRIVWNFYQSREEKKNLSDKDFPMITRLSESAIDYLNEAYLPAVARYLISMTTGRPVRLPGWGLELVFSDDHSDLQVQNIYSGQKFVGVIASDGDEFYSNCIDKSIVKRACREISVSEESVRLKNIVIAEYNYTTVNTGLVTDIQLEYEKGSIVFTVILKSSPGAPVRTKQSRFMFDVNASWKDPRKGAFDLRNHIATLTKNALNTSLVMPMIKPRNSPVLLSRRDVPETAEENTLTSAIYELNEYNFTWCDGKNCSENCPNDRQEIANFCRISCRGRGTTKLESFENLMKSIQSELEAAMKSSVTRILPDSNRAELLWNFMSHYFFRIGDVSNFFSTLNEIEKRMPELFIKRLINLRRSGLFFVVVDYIKRQALVVPKISKFVPDLQRLKKLKISDFNDSKPHWNFISMNKAEWELIKANEPDSAFFRTDRIALEIDETKAFQDIFTDFSVNRPSILMAALASSRVLIGRKEEDFTIDELNVLTDCDKAIKAFTNAKTLKTKTRISDLFETTVQNRLMNLLSKFPTYLGMTVPDKLRVLDKLEKHFEDTSLILVADVDFPIMFYLSRSDYDEMEEPDAPVPFYLSKKRMMSDHETVAITRVSETLVDMLPMTKDDISRAVELNIIYASEIGSRELTERELSINDAWSRSESFYGPEEGLEMQIESVHAVNEELIADLSEQDLLWINLKTKGSYSEFHETTIPEASMPKSRFSVDKDTKLQVESLLSTSENYNHSISFINEFVKSNNIPVENITGDLSLLENLIKSTIVELNNSERKADTTELSMLIRFLKHASSAFPKLSWPVNRKPLAPSIKLTTAGYKKTDSRILRESSNFVSLLMPTSKPAHYLLLMTLKKAIMSVLDENNRVVSSETTTEPIGKVSKNLLVRISNSLAVIANMNSNLSRLHHKQLSSEKSSEWKIDRPVEGEEENDLAASYVSTLRKIFNNEAVHDDQTLRRFFVTLDEQEEEAAKLKENRKKELQSNRFSTMIDFDDLEYDYSAEWFDADD